MNQGQLTYYTTKDMPVRLNIQKTSKLENIECDRTSVYQYVEEFFVFQFEKPVGVSGVWRRPLNDEEVIVDQKSF